MGAVDIGQALANIGLLGFWFATSMALSRGQRDELADALRNAWEANYGPWEEATHDPSFALWARGYIQGWVQGRGPVVESEMEG